MVVAMIFVPASLMPACATEQQLKSVEYRGQRFDLERTYEDFRAYKDDSSNLTPSQVRRAESLMRSAKFGPRFKNIGALDAAVSGLQFPGYGLFVANQWRARPDQKLELVYVEIPARNVNRYIALERQDDGSIVVVADFVAAAQPEIVSVRQGPSGALEYQQQDGQRVVPLPR